MNKDSRKRYSVWVGGVEVNDYLLCEKEAERLKADYENNGYDDVEIIRY